MRVCVGGGVDGARRSAQVMVDAAAYCPTQPLHLGGSFRPDFVCLSFYKMFGYPTGLGALLVRTLYGTFTHPVTVWPCSP